MYRWVSTALITIVLTPFFDNILIPRRLMTNEPTENLTT